MNPREIPNRGISCAMIGYRKNKIKKQNKKE
jgi:hypothetical protein